VAQGVAADGSARLAAVARREGAGGLKGAPADVGATILIIDATALARESVAKLLESEGYRVIRARNGKEAWSVMHKDTPDLVLLDLIMPEMDGVTFLSLLRRSTQWKDVPVVVRTGLTDDDKLVGRAWELGVKEVIRKASFRFEDLLRVVKRYLGERMKD